MNPDPTPDLVVVGSGFFGLTIAERCATELDVLERRALEAEHRGRPADDLVDRRLGPFTLEELPLVRVVAERAQCPGDHRAGGLGAAADEQAGLVHDRLGVEGAAIDLGVGPDRYQVGGLVHRAALGCRGHLDQLAVELHDRGHHVHGDLGVGDAVEAHEPLRPALDVGPARLVPAEQLGREPAGAWMRDVRPFRECRS